MANSYRRMVSEMRIVGLLILFFIGFGSCPAQAQCNGVFSANQVCGSVAGGVPGPIAIPATALPAGVDTNTLNVQTSNYAIATSDCGKTIQLGGGLSFTLTLPSAAGFPGTCSVLIKNTDPVFQKTLSGFPSDVPTALIGLQSLGVKIVNGGWASFYNYPPFRTGTWTPVITAATPGDLTIVYSFQAGQWMRIGSFVFVSCDIVTSTFTHTTASGQMTIGTMPFNGNDDYAGPVDYQGINKTGGYTQMSAVTAASSNKMAFELGGMNLSIGSLQITDMPSAGTVVLRFSVWYQTNDP